MGFKEIEIWLNGFILITFLSHGIFASEVTKQGRALRISITTFPVIESILNKCGNSTMEVKRLRNLDLEIFKAINNMNLQYMKEIFNDFPYAYNS